jgi:lysophospholipase L1-like esterase
MTTKENLERINTEIAQNRDLLNALMARREQTESVPAPLQGVHPLLAAAGLTQKKFKLVAQGDSWFEYPLGWDVVKVLKGRYGHDISNIAVHGSTMNDIVYGLVPKNWLGIPQADAVDRETELINLIQQKQPQAVLLSGGGNDIAGDGFFFSFINNSKSNLTGANQEVIDGVINATFRDAYKGLIDLIHFHAAAVQVFVHGYDYPWPDGRAAINIGVWKAGPWFHKTFNVKNFPYDDEDVAGDEELTRRRKIVAVFIDRFNEMLKALERTYPGFVHHVELRNTLGTIDSDPSLRTKYWANELHPNNDGFVMVADQFNLALNSVLNGNPPKAG